MVHRSQNGSVIPPEACVILNVRLGIGGVVKRTLLSPLLVLQQLQLLLPLLFLQLLLQSVVLHLPLVLQQLLLVLQRQQLLLLL